MVATADMHWRSVPVSRIDGRWITAIESLKFGTRHFEINALFCVFFFLVGSESAQIHIIPWVQFWISFSLPLDAGRSNICLRFRPESLSDMANFAGGMFLFVNDS